MHRCIKNVEMVGGEWNSDCSKPLNILMRGGGVYIPPDSHQVDMPMIERSS